MTKRDLDAADLLLELVARNRGNPPPASTLERTRASLRALYHRAGSDAWRSAVAVAIERAQDRDEPLRGNVLGFLESLLAGGGAAAAASVPAPAVAPKRAAAPPPDPETTIHVRDRIRRVLLERAQATEGAAPR